MSSSKRFKMDPAPAIGIDLGTTNSCVAVLRHGKVEVIANEQGNLVTPSYVSFNQDEYFVGDAAKNAAIIRPESTVFDAKRMIGRKFDDPVVQSDMKQWPFSVKNVDSELKVEVTFQDQTKQMLPEEVSAMVLGHMKDIAEGYLNQEVTNAVVTVPAYFNNAQREATYDAARIAGLNVLRIVSEPTAAAIAYGFNNHEYFAENINILVFDLGGGTFDVSIVTVGKSGETVKATSGDTHLGGEDFDYRLVDFCVQEFKRKYKHDLQGNHRAIRRLKSACERAKRDLSSTTESEIVLDALHDGIDFVMTLTRARFDDLNLTSFKKTLEPVEKALEDAKLTKADINKIVLVGGSTRIPKVHKLLRDFFDGMELDKTINPDEAVAHGAAIYAAALNGNNSDKIFERLLQDVTPLSLGYGSARKYATMRFVIPRNSSIPKTATVRSSTLHDNQNGVVYPVRQGESPNAFDNFLLGDFRLTGFPISLKGQPKLEVTFEIDDNGILRVTARDTVTGSSNGITIENHAGRIKKEQVEEMIKEAKKYRREVAEKKRAKRARNELAEECFKIKNSLDQTSEEVPVSEKTCVLQKCVDVLNWIEENPNEKPESYEGRLKEVKSFAQKILREFQNIFSTD